MKIRGIITRKFNINNEIINVVEGEDINVTTDQGNIIVGNGAGKQLSGGTEEKKTGGIDYHVWKEGNQRASKKFDEESDAKDYIAKQADPSIFSIKGVERA